jgi:hypothetical protein
MLAVKETGNDKSNVMRRANQRAAVHSVWQRTDAGRFGSDYGEKELTVQTLRVVAALPAASDHLEYPNMNRPIGHPVRIARLFAPENFRALRGSVERVRRHGTPPEYSGLIGAEYDPVGDLLRFVKSAMR